MAFSMLTDSDKICMSAVLWASDYQKFSWHKQARKNSNALPFTHVAALLYLHSCGSCGIRQSEAVKYLKIEKNNVIGRRNVIGRLVERRFVTRQYIGRFVWLFITVEGSIYAQKLLKEIKGFNT